MAGFDPKLVGSLVAIPTFQQTFGVKLSGDSFVIQAQWQSEFNLGVPVGQVLGSIVLEDHFVLRTSRRHNQLTSK